MLIQYPANFFIWDKKYVLTNLRNFLQSSSLKKIKVYIALYVLPILQSRFLVFGPISIFRIVLFTRRTKWKPLKLCKSCENYPDWGIACRIKVLKWLFNWAQYFVKKKLVGSGWAYVFLRKKKYICTVYIYIYIYIYISN